MRGALRRLYKIWRREVQRIADRHGVEIATGHMSDMWQVRDRNPEDRRWVRERYAERQPHPALTELVNLCERVEDFRIGPANMEYFKPKKWKNESGNSSTGAAVGTL